SSASGLVMKICNPLSCDPPSPTGAFEPSTLAGGPPDPDEHAAIESASARTIETGDAIRCTFILPFLLVFGRQPPKSETHACARHTASFPGLRRPLSAEEPRLAVVLCPGNPAVPWTRIRRPVALRPRLTAGLPLSAHNRTGPAPDPLCPARTRPSGGLPADPAWPSIASIRLRRSGAPDPQSDWEGSKQLPCHC